MTHYSEQWKITQNKNSPPFTINSNKEREREEKSNSKTVRKPLKDVSNNKNNKYNNGGRFLKPLDMKNLGFSEKEEDRCKEVEEEEEKDGLLDCLLLVQSDLSSLIHQVTAISLLTICLFTRKWFRKQGLHLALCNLNENFAQSLFHSPFVFVWLLRKCGGYICVFEYFASNWKRNLLCAFQIIDCTVF